MLHLQEGATLQSGKYKIEKVLGQGGFGITYLAVQYPLKKKVAIKEFFIHDLCFRDDTASVQVLTPSRRLCPGCYAIQAAHRATPLRLVLRGGGWNGAGKNCRVSNRDSRYPDYNSDRLGLRLAM